MAEVSVSVVTDLPEKGAHIAAAGAAAPGLARADVIAAAHEVKDAVVPILADHTPHRSGDLAASTMGEVSASGDGAQIDLTQPALSKPGPGGRGGGTPYVQFVVLGRGDVYPVEARALAGDGFGPVAHAGPAAPNPYPDEAAPDMAAAMDEILAQHGRELIGKIVSMMH